MQHPAQEYPEVVRCLMGVLKHRKHLDDMFTEPPANGRREPPVTSRRDPPEGNITPLVRQICYGVIRQYYALDKALRQLLDKPLPPKHLDLELLLLAGIYSIIALNRPAYASVNAAVEAVLRLQKPWAKALVNGVLRQYIRDRDIRDKKIPAATASGDDFSDMANMSQKTEAELNHPAWLITALTNAWPQHPEIFQCNNAQGPLTLRVNNRKTTRHAYEKLLQQAAICFQPGTLASTAITLSTAMPVDDLPGFKQGLVSVQDEAPQLAASLMNLVPGLTVLDACAAPGGKTGHLLESEPDIHLVAIDKHPQRLKKIQDNLERLELSCELLNTALEDYNPGTTFDRILLDVPCSGTGIIRRHPDIKLLRKQADIDKLGTIQRGLLNKAFDLLKTDGELLYATCSLLPDENDQILRWLLASRSDASLLPVALAVAPSSAAYCMTETGLQLFPTLKQHDGFFYSRITKTQEASHAQRPRP